MCEQDNILRGQEGVNGVKANMSKTKSTQEKTAEICESYKANNTKVIK